MRGAPIGGMANSPLSLVLAALAATTVFTRVMAPVARELRNCLFLWLALRGTRPDQRPQVIKALPPLEPPPLPSTPDSRVAKPSDTATATRTDSPSTTEPQRHPATTAQRCGHIRNVPTCSNARENDINPG
jgi:hypothetical protein